MSKTPQEGLVQEHTSNRGKTVREGGTGQTPLSYRGHDFLDGACLHNDAREPVNRNGKLTPDCHGTGKLGAWFFGHLTLRWDPKVCCGDEKYKELGHACRDTRGIHHHLLEMSRFHSASEKDGEGSTGKGFGSHAKRGRSEGRK